MTNQLDSLLQAVEDALEEGEVQLWQPDLTDLVLPGDRTVQDTADREGGEAETRSDRSEALASFPALDGWQALPRFQRTPEEVMQALGETRGVGQSSPQAVIARSVSPALLEQLNELDDTQAGAQALSRAQTRNDSLSTRTGAGEKGGGVQYDPAALRDFPLAAAAAAAQQAEDARAVDRAFQRDSRRYDRGFSLY